MFGKLKIEEHNGTVFIPINKTAVKACVGKYTIYDREWLMDHIETEYLRIIEARKFRDAQRKENSVCKDWEE